MKPQELVAHLFGVEAEQVAQKSMFLVIQKVGVHMDLEVVVAQILKQVEMVPLALLLLRSTHNESSNF
jgi:hypothetical protein